MTTLLQAHNNIKQTDMVAEDINPLWLAQSRLRRRRYDDCIELCTAALQHNPLDQVLRDGDAQHTN